MGSTALPLTALFSNFAKAARGTALRNHTKNDTFGEILAASRADVYSRAAEMVRLMPPAEAAAEMMHQAQQRHVRTPPLMDFDSAGVQYTTARAWQFCAWQIDPRLPEVAPGWDG